MRDFRVIDSCQKQLDDLEKSSLVRHANIAEMTTSVTGRFSLPDEHPVSATFFATNDYLGLSQHPQVKAAAVQATFRGGTGSGASRSISGTSQAVVDLETSLAALKQTDAALVFSSGFHANHGAITSLVGRNDVVLCDRLAHASIIDAAHTSGARLVRFGHNDVRDLTKRLDALRAGNRKDSKVLIATEGLFSMDGDIAPLSQILDTAAEYGAAVLIDDAHATGTIGQRGAGSLSHHDLHAHPLVVDGNAIQVGTLSKAIGSLGGFVAGPRPLIESLRSRARSFTFTTALPPASVAAAATAVKILSSSEGDALREKLAENVALLRTLLAESGLDVMGDPLSPIIPVVLGDSRTVISKMKSLLRSGFVAPGVRPPTVREGSARIRLTANSSHRASDIKRLCKLFDPAEPEFSAGAPSDSNILTVLGSDTGVGKTYIACRLIEQMLSEGLACDALKPVETGYGVNGVGSDASSLAASLGHNDPSNVTVFTSPEPISPHLALGGTFDEARVIDQVRSRSATAFTIVETAGGVLSPLAHGYTMADLARDIGGKCILVTDPYLGTFSRTCSALEAATARGATVVALVVSESRSEPFDPRTMDELRALTGLPCVFLGPGSNNEDALSSLVKLILPDRARETVTGDV